MSGSRFSFLATDPDSYEHFMGRWSARLANPFLDFAAIQPGTRVLDLGCGTGVLSVALAERGCTVVGIDASEAYLDGARRHRSHPLVTYEVGDGQTLSHADGSFDSCVSTLAIDVVPEIERFAAEMRRVTRPGGVVASGTFDFWGGFSASELVLDTGAVFDEALRERRDYLRSRPLLWPNGQAGLWRKVGLIDVVEVPIVMSFDYQSFEDYWTSLATGPTGMAQRLQMLPSEIRDEICRHVRSGYLAGMPDGPRSFAGIIRAVRGLVPN
jgi:SAM-dependent methyltransferase